MKLELEERDVQAIASLVSEMVVAQITERLAVANEASLQKQLWTEREAADMLGISPFTLRNYRLDGRIAATTSKGRILYDRVAVARAKQYLTEKFQ